MKQKLENGKWKLEKEGQRQSCLGSDRSCGHGAQRAAPLHFLGAAYVELGGEAVGGDGGELPGGELEEVFFEWVGGDFQGAVWVAVDAGGDGVAVVADEFGDAGVEEEGEVAERVLGWRDLDCLAVDG